METTHTLFRLRSNRYFCQTRDLGVSLPNLNSVDGGIFKLPLEQYTTIPKTTLRADELF